MELEDDNPVKLFDPQICWTTTYIEKIEYENSRLVIAFSASLLTSHPMFDESLLPSSDEPVSVEYRIIFDGVSNFQIGENFFDSFQLLSDLDDDCAETYQIFDIKRTENNYEIAFYELDPFKFTAITSRCETGNYIVSANLPYRLDSNIDWSLSSLNEIQIGQDIVFHIAACLNSWHPRFEKTKVKGHWGKYQSTLRFPKVKDYRFEPNSKAFNSKIEFTPDSYQILEVIENIDEYQIFLGIWSESSNRKMIVNSEPPVFEIGEYISSGPFIRSPYPPRINVPPHNDETISDLMGDLKTPPKGSVSE